MKNPLLTARTATAYARTALSLGLGLLSVGLGVLVWGPSTWERPTGPWNLLFLVLHVGSCLGMCASFHLRRESNRPFRFLLFVFCFSFFLPLLGQLGLLLGVYPRLGRIRDVESTGMKTVQLERIHARVPLFHDRFGLGGFGTRLRNPKIPLVIRVRLLMILSRRNTPFANRMLRKLLRDADDEIRLAAYSILERREKEIQASLADAESGSNGTARHSGSAPNWKQLAILHWETSYLELAEGEMANRHLLKALQALENIRDSEARDPFLVQLKLRILTRLGKWKMAEAFVVSHPTLQLPPRRIAPYLAELAFHARRWGSVPEFLRQLDPRTGNADLDKVRRFWLAQEESHGA